MQGLGQVLSACLQIFQIEFTHSAKSSVSIDFSRKTSILL